MTNHFARRLACVALAAGVAGCDLSTPTEPQNPIDLALDFCDDDVPVWFGYQNEDMITARRVFEDAEGTFRFTATNRTSIAIVRETGASVRTEFIYATNEELASISHVGCLEASGAKTVHGSLAGVGTGQAAVVSLGFSTAVRQAGSDSYTLASLPDRPLDLVASRQMLTASASTADRIVIRRTQNVANGGTLSLIDFAGDNDVVPAATANASVTGILSGEGAVLQSNFFSQLETSHSLSFADGLGNGTLTFAAVPQGLLADGDYHDLLLLSINASTGSVRGAENFFRAASAQTLALGPVLNEPIITDATTATAVRLRMQLPAQLSYDDAISVEYRQQRSTSVVTVAQFATAGYHGGTPSVWVLDTPDLTGAPGWQERWALTAGTGIDWTVTGFAGRSTLLFGAKPADGEFVRYAIRHSVPGAGPAVMHPSSSPRNGALRWVYTIRSRERIP